MLTLTSMTHKSDTGRTRKVFSLLPTSVNFHGILSRLKRICEMFVFKLSQYISGLNILRSHKLFHPICSAGNADMYEKNVVLPQAVTYLYIHIAIFPSRVAFTMKSYWILERIIKRGKKYNFHHIPFRRTWNWFGFWNGGLARCSEHNPHIYVEKWCKSE